ncbi:hypothetical protein EVG20_g6947 [Dentipellis fragilis]|uniref:DUF4604 domain-containing protein n=1 Tax=Dentipellis fragilis TaxID=205917 RepID=A0A4Y9YJU4_9AGAM|nr:hypothetical protein EVG20_g6947 [Dentipellis fragilis]
MAPKEPNRHQLSSRLAYSQNTPAFLQKFKNRIAGISDDEDENGDDEYEYVGGGRPPIPKRPAIPERPADDPGSADEDADDERPQVVVLREGKHLSQREVENEKRKAKGLPPLPEPQELPSKSGGGSTAAQKLAKEEKKEQYGLSFSSGFGSKKSSGKRKAVGQPDDDEQDGPSDKTKKSSKRKGKKAPKTLLSFSDDA